MWLKMPHFQVVYIWAGVLILMGLFVSTAEAQTKSMKARVNNVENTKAWNLKWSLKTSGSYFDEGFDSEETKRSSTLAATRAKLGFDYWLSPELFLDVRPTFRFQSGRNQSIDGAEKPSNGLGLTQAAVQWLPTDSVLLTAGALNQRDLHTSLVSDELPFPGARLTLKTSPQDWDLQLSAETSVPASNGLETGTNEVEPHPTKNAAVVQFNWIPKPYLKVKNRISYFSFNNLPTEVASASSRLGNSTYRLTEEDYAFQYKYQGYEAATDWELPIHRKWDWLVSMAGVKNNSAPAGFNSGYYANTGLRWLMDSRNHITARGGYFYVEPDAAPAYFSNKEHFRTNRVGYYAEGLWHFRKQKFTIGAAYQEAQVIYQDFSQSRAREYVITLETDYESI